MTDVKKYTYTLEDAITITHKHIDFELVQFVYYPRYKSCWIDFGDDSGRYIKTSMYVTKDTYLPSIMSSGRFSFIMSVKAYDDIIAHIENQYDTSIEEITFGRMDYLNK